MEYLVSGAENNTGCLKIRRALNADSVFWLFICSLLVDQSKETAFKVAPSKWEAVDESELESQGKTCNWH